MFPHSNEFRKLKYNHKAILHDKVVREKKKQVKSMVVSVSQEIIHLILASPLYSLDEGSP